MDLDITTSRLGEESVVAASGEIDLTSCGRLRDGLERVGLDDTIGTVVDLTNVGFIDSTGLSVLVDGAHKAHAEGRTFGVVAGGHLRELLRITGLDTVMTVHSELADALGAGDPSAVHDEAPHS